MPGSPEAMPGSPEAVQPESAPMVPAPFALTSKRQETPDTWTLELRPLAGALAFAPGQFMMLSASGAGEVPISISGDPSQSAALLHTVRAVGLATRAICRAAPGEVLCARGPYGRPWPLTGLEGVDVLVVAGGIGLAPLRGAILALLARRERLGRVALLYGGRAPDQLLYAEELRRWAEEGLEVMTTVDSAGPEWLGHVGVVPRLLSRAEFEPSEALALVCGPEVMMRFALAALERRGLRRDRVYLSMERNMQCGVGHCGHCQLGPTLVCRDGPVYAWSELDPWLRIREL